LKISNLGQKTLDTIYEALEKLGFHATPEPPVEEANRPPVKEPNRPPVRRFAFLRR
jgi:hypothetical protein